MAEPGPVTVRRRCDAAPESENRTDRTPVYSCCRIPGLRLLLLGRVPRAVPGNRTALITEKCSRLRRPEQPQRPRYDRSGLIDDRSVMRDHPVGQVDETGLKEQCHRRPREAVITHPIKRRNLRRGFSASRRNPQAVCKGDVLRVRCRQPYSRVPFICVRSVSMASAQLCGFVTRGTSAYFSGSVRRSYPV
ncbi:hypothetical protein ACVMB0_006158 [Bradyrhizobium sp. USDA 4451]